jgi:hypothetical protein
MMMNIKDGNQNASKRIAEFISTNSSVIDLHTSCTFFISPSTPLAQMAQMARTELVWGEQEKCEGKEQVHTSPLFTSSADHLPHGRYRAKRRGLDITIALNGNVADVVITSVFTGVAAIVFER